MRVTDDEEKWLSGHPKTENTKKISELPEETKIGQGGLIKCMTIISMPQYKGKQVKKHLQQMTVGSSERDKEISKNSPWTWEMTLIYTTTTTTKQSMLYKAKKQVLRGILFCF